MENRFYIDEKVTIWRRTWYSSEDENGQQKLIESMTGGSQDFLNSNMEDSEMIFETEEQMTPEDNDGQSTIEIYTDNHELIWTNEKK